MTRLKPRAYFWLKIVKAHVPGLRNLRLLKKAAVVERYYDRPIMGAAAGNALLFELVSTGRPFAAGKIGDTELEVLLKYDAARGDTRSFFDAVAHRGHELDFLHLNSGVFPKTRDVVARWAEVYLDALSQLDLLGVWYNSGEDDVIHKYAAGAALTADIALEPYYHHPPWTRGLRGKRVLVVTPFAGSIQQQWRRQGGEQLFPGNPEVMPSFELSVIRSPFSAGLAPPTHKDWHVALADLQEQMANSDWDIAIVGAGAYSIPLCAHARTKLGRAAVHLGGATQLLFGVRGRRWESHEFIRTLFNEWWIRPLAGETPSGHWRNDGGAYW